MPIEAQKTPYVSHPLGSGTFDIKSRDWWDKLQETLVLRFPGHRCSPDQSLEPLEAPWTVAADRCADQAGTAEPLVEARKWQAFLDGTESCHEQKVVRNGNPHELYGGFHSHHVVSKMVGFC